MKGKTLLALAFSVVIAFFTRTIIGAWLVGSYAYSGSFFLGPSNPENFDGFLFSYVFFSALITSAWIGNIKYGFFVALPIVVLVSILGSIDPHLWLSLLLLVLGLGLAWIILQIKNKVLNK